MTKQGILYGVGVGPGDPELLTLKAVRLLQEADVIAAPDKGNGEQVALRIVDRWIQGKPLLSCPMPMTREQAVLDRCHDEVANSIGALLDQGKTVVFITLGDPTVYSTYLYLHRRILAMGYRAELVPGVPSFCAAAARLNVSLCEGSQRLMIVPASRTELTDCLEQDANLVFMKAGRELGTLRQALAEHGLMKWASMVADCGMPSEAVWEHLEDAPETSGYFTIVVVRQGENAT